MYIFQWMLLLACGDKSTDTATVDDTATEVDTASGVSEGNEGSGTTDTGETGTTETGTVDPDTGTTNTATWGSDTPSLLTQGGGCGDYFVYAQNPDDTLSLQISGQGLAAEAHASDRGVAEYTFTLNPNTDDIQPLIVAQSGQYLNEWSCNDAVMYEPIVLENYVAISGTMQVTVVAEGTPTDWGEVPANMSIQLTDVCFNAPTELCISSMTLQRFVGWFPG